MFLNPHSCFHMYSIARECLEKLSSNKDNLLWTTTNRTKLLEGAKAWKLDFLFYSKKSVGKLDCSGSGWYLWPCNRVFFMVLLNLLLKIILIHQNAKISFSIILFQKYDPNRGSESGSLIDKELFAKHICYIWDKVFRNGPSKICGRQPLKFLKWYDLPNQTISLQIFSRLSSTNCT